MKNRSRSRKTVGSRRLKGLREASPRRFKEQAFPGGFEGCVRSMAARPGVRDARALCAFIGRRAGKIPGSTREATIPEVRQFGEEWCVVKPDGTKGLCFSGEDANKKAKDAARSQAVAEARIKGKFLEQDDGKPVIVPGPEGVDFFIVMPDGQRIGPFDSREQAEAALMRLGDEAGIEEQEPEPGDDFTILTTSDEEFGDNHVHSIIELDEEGNGKTDTAGTPPHSHDVRSFEVQPVTVDSKVSKHEGSLPDDSALEAGHTNGAQECPEGFVRDSETGQCVRKVGESCLPFRISTGNELMRGGRFMETGPLDAKGKEWDVVLIEEGESLNGRIYTREVLEDAFRRRVFEGVPAFGFIYRTKDGLILDHGIEGVDTGDFPKDVAGYHRSIRYMETSPGKMGLVSRFRFIDDVLQRKKLESHENGNPDLFGFSIDAVGEGEELSGGRVMIKYIVRAASDDLVSHPAAGGRFLRIVASLAKRRKLLTEDGHMNPKDILFQLIMEINPDLLTGIDQATVTLDELKALIQGEEFEAIRKAFAEISAPPAAAAAASTGEAAPAAPAAAAVATEKLINESVERGIQAGLKPILAREHATLVEAAITESGLGKSEEAAQLIRDLAERKPNDAAHLKAVVSKSQKLMESAGWQDPQLGNVTVGEAPRDKYVHALEGAMKGRPQKGVPPFKNVRDMVARTCGIYESDPQTLQSIFNTCMGSVIAKYNDWRNGHGDKGPLFESYKGRMHEAARRRFGMREAIDTAQLAEIFGDSVTRAMIADYELPGMNDWRALASKVGFVDDTRVQRRDRLGYYPDLATVAEGASYVAIASLSDEEVTIIMVKKGNFEQITQEAILQDDLQSLARVPGRLMTTAMQNVRKLAFGLFDPATNPVIFDTFPLFQLAGAHVNAIASTLSVAFLNTVRALMRKQTTFGSTFTELGAANIPKFLIVPADLENVANQISAGQWEPTASNFQFANLNKGIQVIIPDFFTDVDAFVAIADPANTPTFEMDFVGNSDAPELWTQDDPTQGEPFDSDQIKIKVRIWRGASIIDFRSFGAGIPGLV